jgi:hypothetical protein
MFKKVLGILVVLIILGALIGSHHSKKPSTDTAAAATGHAQLSMVLNRSDTYCLPVPGQARIWVSIGVRNRGSASGTINPWATFDYSDGGNSTESLDTNTGSSLTVPAHSLRVARFYHTYNAQQHDVIRCSGFLDLGDSSASGYLLPIES